MIEKGVIRQVYNRDKQRCVICGSKAMLERVPHHCFFKSQYFEDDKNDAWNLVIMCMAKREDGVLVEGCHRKLHRGDKWMESRCKILALGRYEGKHRDKILAIMKRKMFEI